MTARRITRWLIPALVLLVVAAALWTATNYKRLLARYYARRVASLDPTAGPEVRKAWLAYRERLVGCGLAGAEELAAALAQIKWPVQYGTITVQVRDGRPTTVKIEKTIKLD